MKKASWSKKIPTKVFGKD